MPMNAVSLAYEVKYNASWIMKFNVFRKYMLINHTRTDIL